MDHTGVLVLPPDKAGFKLKLVKREKKVISLYTKKLEPCKYVLVDSWGCQFHETNLKKHKTPRGSDTIVVEDVTTSSSYVDKSSKLRIR